MQKTVMFLEMEWSYEQAVIAKGYGNVAVPAPPKLGNASQEVWFNLCNVQWKMSVSTKVHCGTLGGCAFPAGITMNHACPYNPTT